jgi:flagellar hook assembly protein FlgD
MDELQLKVFPNPVSSVAKIEVNNTIAGNVSIDIYDINGKLTRNLYQGFMAEGSKSVSWDGTSNSGNSCANGIYLCKVSGNGSFAEEKIILMR